MGLSGLIDKRLKKLRLADGAIIVLIHGLEVRLEGGLVKLCIWLDAKEHAAAELTHLSLFELAITVGIDASKKFFSCLNQLSFTDLGHFR